MRTTVDVAVDICKIIMFTSNYVVQIVLQPFDSDVIVKVGDTASKRAMMVNVSAHRKDTNNLLQDKLLAAKIAFRLLKSFWVDRRPKTEN